VHLRELPRCPRMVLDNEIEVFLVSKEIKSNSNTEVNRSMTER
jgi:hypothetical protein